MAEKLYSLNAIVTFRFLVQTTFLLLGLDVFSVSNPSMAQEYTPDHDEVKKMVAKGMGFLSSPKLERTRNGGGYTVLMGYTAMKATEDHDHPLVKAALPVALHFSKAARDTKSAALHTDEVIYEASITAMFLSALDPTRYRTEIESVRNYLLSRQRPNGAFGYLRGDWAINLGDVSQSQYAALAFWSIKQANIDVDLRAVEKLTLWLASSQFPDGSWTYQWPARQEDLPTRRQMVAAGLSAILVCADSLGVLRGAGAGLLEEEGDDEDVPRAFRRIVKETKKDGSNFTPKTVTRTGIAKISKSAEGWLNKTRYTRGGDWYYYLIYSQERYESFLEIINGKRLKSPAWYNNTVKALKKYQAANGGWGVDEKDLDPAGSEAATCFSILFLLRNTQKAIGDLKSADSVGGYGLSNVADVGVVDGKIVDKSQVTSIEDAMKLLEGSHDGSTEDKLLADRMALDLDPIKRKEQLNRFARLLRSPDARARRVAAKLLGRGDDLDYAPDLIFALSEGEQDGQVLRIAENSLRILSRQLTTYILPNDGPITAADRVKSERHWQNWYLKIRPDYVFVE